MTHKVPSERSLHRRFCLLSVCILASNKQMRLHHGCATASRMRIKTLRNYISASYVISCTCACDRDATKVGGALDFEPQQPRYRVKTNNSLVGGSQMDLRASHS